MHVINPFDYDGGRAFARKSRRTAAAIERLRDRASHAGVPVIYVNDNLGKWQSDVKALVEFCTRPDMPGADLVARLKPGKNDYVLLKASLSGFYHTPLDTMLRLGRVRTLIITGFATDNSVLFTAADAYMRDYRLVIPTDCVAAKTADGQRRALTTMTELFAARTTRSTGLRLARRGMRTTR